LFALDKIFEPYKDVPVSLFDSKQFFLVMLYSAKHGLATACRPSDCLSIRLWCWWIVII